MLPKLRGGSEFTIENKKSDPIENKYEIPQ